MRIFTLNKEDLVMNQIPSVSWFIRNWKFLSSSTNGSICTLKNNAGKLPFAHRCYVVTLLEKSLVRTITNFIGKLHC